MPVSSPSKGELVRRLQQAGRVAMVGDGINDAPALMQADVGVAMGGDTDIATESADVIIVGNEVTAVLTAGDISRRNYRTTRQNVALAFLFNGIGIPTATPSCGSITVRKYASSAGSCILQAIRQGHAGTPGHGDGGVHSLVGAHAPEDTA